MPVVYIITPVYNVENYLERCVDSLVNQSYGNVKIVLIDDGSTDSSPKICDNYAERFENISVIHKKNGGLSDARNAGLSYCFENSKNIDDDYVTFVDSDDFIHTDFVKKMIALSRDNDCQAIQCSYEKGSENHFSDFTEKTKITVSDGRNALLGYSLKSQCCAKLYKLNLFLDESFRTGVLNEDEYFTYRIIYKCKKTAFTNEKLYYYFQRRGSIMHHIANNIKNSPHRNDWLYAYLERIAFFEEKEDYEQVLKTYEKICTDIILRFTEQMQLPKEERDKAVGSGEYMRVYRSFFKKMIKLKTIPAKRRLMYIIFYIFPISAVITSYIRPLRT